MPLTFAFMSARGLQKSHRQDRVDALLNKMTLSQKIGLIHGARPTPATTQGQGGYMPGDATEERITIPAKQLSIGI
jgi:hypothetical protein